VSKSPSLRAIRTCTLMPRTRAASIWGPTPFAPFVGVCSPVRHDCASLLPHLAHRHVIPDVAVQAPLTIATFEPDNDVFYLCLPGAELQVGLANLIGSVAGYLEIQGFERDAREAECRRGCAPKF